MVVCGHSRNSNLNDFVPPPSPAWAHCISGNPAFRCIIFSKPFAFLASVLADTHKISAKAIQRILGHKNLSTTERYIKKIDGELAGTLNLLLGKGYHRGLPEVNGGIK
jgi:hypothetical protein